MYQLLIDLTDINTLNALYCSLYLGVTLKLLWAWNMEFSFMGAISESAETRISHPLYFFVEKNCINGNLIIKRVVKYIRRKSSSQDDTEEPFSSLSTKPILLPF